MPSVAPLSPPESVLRKSSRTSKPAKHCDGSEVEPLKVAKRTTPPESPKSEPLLKQLSKKSHPKARPNSPTQPSEAFITLKLNPALLRENLATKKRKPTGPQPKAGTSPKRAKTQAQAQAQAHTNANELQPALISYKYDLTPTNPTHGLDALFLAGELRKQQDVAQECHVSNLICRRSLNKRMKDLHRTRDPGVNDKELALLQSNLSIVEDGLRRYPRHQLLRHSAGDWSDVPERGYVPMELEEAARLAVCV
ncbi:MAG: hypothetical protein Q9198_006356 [Flavoplaca austrocitrina]